MLPSAVTMGPASCKEILVRHTFRGALVALTGAGLAVGACSLESAAPVVPCTTFTTFAIGDTIRDSLTATSCRLGDLSYESVYRFQLAGQTKLRMTLSSPSDTAFLLVLDSTNFGLVNSLYTSSADTSAVVEMILRAGTYQLIVNSWHQSPSGRFRVLTAVDSTPIAGCDNTNVIWLSTGISTSQTITSADCKGFPLGAKYYYHRYRLVIHEQRLLAFTEHSTSFIPQVTLISGLTGGTLGVTSLDSSGTNARVSFTPTAPDLLLLLVGSQDSLQVGPYSLTIQ